MNSLKFIDIHRKVFLSDRILNTTFFYVYWGLRLWLMVITNSITFQIAITILTIFLKDRDWWLRRSASPWSATMQCSTVFCGLTSMQQLAGIWTNPIPCSFFCVQIRIGMKQKKCCYPLFSYCSIQLIFQKRVYLCFYFKRITCV